MSTLYEIALFEYHLTPEYINEQWTEELLVLMFKARTRRIKAANLPSKEAAMSENQVTDSDLFHSAGIAVDRR